MKRKVFIAEEKSGKCGDNLTWMLDDKGTLTITGTGDMWDYGIVRAVNGFVTTAPWGKYSGKLKKLLIKEGITNIGNNAFAFCGGLNGALMIPNTVESIGAYAFYYCSGFDKTLTIPGSVTNIGECAFAYCCKLTGNLVIPEKVTSIGSHAFAYCSGFDGSLTIPNSITYIDVGTFTACMRLSGSLTIPESVTSIAERAFIHCSGFTGNLTIPQSVTNIGESAFAYCTGFNKNEGLQNSIQRKWCNNSKCSECTEGCHLDDIIPCSPDCENLTDDGRIRIGDCIRSGCDAALSVFGYTDRKEMEEAFKGKKITGYPFDYTIDVYEMNKTAEEAKAESDRKAKIKEYRPKFEGDWLILDNQLDWEACLDYAINHSLNVKFTDTDSGKQGKIMAAFIRSNYTIEHGDEAQSDDSSIILFKRREYKSSVGGIKMSIFEAAKKQYNSIMWDFCWEHVTIGTNLSEGTKNWNIRDMVSEAQYHLDTCYEDGNLQSEGKDLQELYAYYGRGSVSAKEIRKEWLSKTRRLRNFISKYSQYALQEACTEGHCSEWD